MRGELLRIRQSIKFVIEFSQVHIQTEFAVLDFLLVLLHLYDAVVLKFIHRVDYLFQVQFLQASTFALSINFIEDA